MPDERVDNVGQVVCSQWERDGAGAITDQLEDVDDHRFLTKTEENLFPLLGFHHIQLGQGVLSPIEQRFVRDPDGDDIVLEGRLEKDRRDHRKRIASRWAEPILRGPDVSSADSPTEGDRATLGPREHDEISIALYFEIVTTGHVTHP